MPEETSEEKLNAVQEALRRKKKEYVEIRFDESKEAEVEVLDKEITDLENQIKELIVIVGIEAKLAEFRKYIPLAKNIVESSKGDLIEVVKMIPALLADLGEGLEPELARISEIRAKALYRDYENLKKAGFDQEAAFRILLAQIKPFGFTDGLAALTKSLPKK